jgi:hypothetical protein
MKNIENRADKYFGILFAMLSIATYCNGQAILTNTEQAGGTHKPYSFPLKAGISRNRYLVDGNNRPFFWLGDAAWSLIAQVSNEDADFYLDNRRKKGFSIALVSLIEHKVCTNAPSDYYGELPFSGKPFTTPNEKYFEHADYVIRAAAQRNIVVLLAPLYLGYDCKDEGWCAEVKAASANDMYSWGLFIGKRYKDFGNIIWVIGGDTDPSVVKDKVNEMIRGIRENDSLHLFSAHNQPETMAITPWSGESWINVNNVYSYDSILYSHFKTAYSMKPVMPFYLCESAYENEHHSTPQQLRAQAYQAVLSGAMGHIFGNCPVWHFGAVRDWCNTTDWKTELDNSGSMSMDYFQRLFLSRSWQTLIPDFDHKVITEGFGTWGTKDYVTTALTADGNTLIAYLPYSRSVTADLNKITGKKALCRWYDPSSGKVIDIGTIKTSGYHTFTPLSKSDWVLIIDNESENLPEPGSVK